MIKITELNPIASGPLLANSTAVIPISTGNSSFNTFKVTISSIGEYILSNAGNVTAGNVTVSSNVSAGNVLVSGNLIGNVTSTIANVTGTLLTSNINLGNVSGIVNKTYPSSNNKRIVVRPSMDISGDGTVNSADALFFLQVLSNTPTSGNILTYPNVPFVMQHSNKTATGVMFTNTSIINEVAGNVNNSGQIYITAGNVDYIHSYLRVGYDNGVGSDIYLKANTTGLSSNLSVAGSATVVGSVAVGSVSSTGNISAANLVIPSTGNINVGNVIVSGNVAVASTGTITTGNIRVSNNTETGLLLSSKYIQSPYPILSPEKIKNQGAGTFTYVNNLSAGTYPRMMDIDPSGRFLYLTDYSGNVVRQFSINQTNGTLSVITTAIATDTGPWKIKVDPTGRFIYVINSSASTISQYSINQTTGALTSIAAAVAVALGPNGITIDPTGRFVYVTNSTTSTISQYSINQSTGALTTITTAVATNTGVVDIVADPTGRFVYTTSTNKLAAWNINQSTGELTQINDLTFSGTPAVCKIDPAGRYLYVATVGQTILQFSINQSTGVLTSVNSSVATANRPLDIAFDPNGWYMYTTNLNDNTLSVFRINQYNGAVSVVSTASSSATGPEGIVVDPTGRFLYATNITSGYVTFYRLNDFALGFTSNINTGNVTATGKVTTDNAVVNGLAEIWRANIASIYLNPNWDYIDSGTVIAGSPDPSGGSQCYIDTTGGALAATLGDGTIDGFLKYFIMYTDGGDLTMTVTKAAWKNGASGTITFNDVGDTCTLQWFFDKWFIMGSYGVTVA